MRVLLSPSVPEISRVSSESLDEAIAQLVGILTPTGGGFNYLDATKCAKAAYKGLHNLPSLTKSRRLNDGSVGAKSNLEVAQLACPVAFGRKTQLIELSPRSFQYGAGRSASYRVPFLFLEHGVIKLYFLQPRKNTVFAGRSVSMFASIVKKYLLDTEFYDEKVDIEFVEVAERVQKNGRQLKVYNVADVEILDDAAIERHLSIVREALTVIENEKLVTKKRRPLKDKDLPLFS